MFDVNAEFWGDVVYAIVAWLIGLISPFIIKVYDQAEKFSMAVGVVLMLFKFTGDATKGKLDSQADIAYVGYLALLVVTNTISAYVGVWVNNILDSIKDAFSWLYDTFRGF